MYIKASEVPNLLPDNDFRYFSMLEGIVNSVDSNSSVEIIKKPKSYSTRISPSSRDEMTINHILEEVIKFHTLLGIHIDLSKSIKTSGRIFYDIELM